MKTEIGEFTMRKYGWNSITEPKMRTRAEKWKIYLSDAEFQKKYGLNAEKCKTACDACDNFINAFDASNINKTPNNTHIKNDAKKAFKKTISGFANECIRYNRDIPHTVLMDLGLAPSDEEVSESISIDDGPDSVVVINSRKNEVVIVKYIGGKPNNRCLCRIRYCFADTPPSSATVMTNYTEESFGHNPWEHVFSGKRGQILYYCLRWEMTNGDVGKWSNVKSCIVP
jgi:hypothetical protein